MAVESGKMMITGNYAAAYGAKLARPEVIPIYPITPQTSTVEKIVEFIDRGELFARFVPVESEHSALTIAETRVLKSVLGIHARTVPVSSIKAVVGHAFGAAGELEAAACLLAIRDGVVPPTANFEEPDPECDVDCVPNRARAVPVRVALTLSAGFGGQNAAIVLAGV